MELKNYQRESLDIIVAFCNTLRNTIRNGLPHPVRDAFETICHRDYQEVSQLSPHVPYICVRIPTGGGKTLLAAHAAGTIARQLGHSDYPLVLWVTPSTTIRDQTLNGLKTPRHSYHDAFREGVHGAALEVMTVEEALYAGQSRYAGAAVVIVTTIQNYRKEDTEGRKIYRENGYLMDHFTNLPPEIQEQLQEPDGRIISSLANVLKLHHPVVIMDEAHNARTPISFDSLNRFEPMAVLELTATPQNDSNVLHAVSALQLKNEGMIKLPVELESLNDWTDVLDETVQIQKKLEQKTTEFRQTAGRYIRPIVLLQAQPKSKTKETHTVDKVKEALIQHLKVPEEFICIATGDQDELTGIELRNENCPVRYVITVEKLREGWDCPFAYILGSVGNVATETAVEQLLGRVLRMPDALPTGISELDRAYAVVHCHDIAETAKKLTDGLVLYCGFDRDSVRDVFQYRREIPRPLLPLTLWTIALDKPIDIKKLPETIRQKIIYDPKTNIVSIQKNLTREDYLSIQNISPPENYPALEESWKRECLANIKFDELVQPIRIPQMMVVDGNQKYLFDPIEIEEFHWELNRCDITVSENEFSGDMTVGERSFLDIGSTGNTEIRYGGNIDIKEFLFWEKDDWSKDVLARWLNNELHHGGQWVSLSTAISFPWILEVINDLLKRCNLKILVRRRHDLAKIIEQKIWDHAKKQEKAGIKTLLKMTGLRRIETIDDDLFNHIIDEKEYLPYHFYHGSYRFEKHAFIAKIGKMNGEEEICAEKIDRHKNVKRWVRNLDPSTGSKGFSLSSIKRFFPDFVAELNDNRTAVIEYKGGDRANNPDELDKKSIGENWASHSNGKCVFIWVADKNWNALNQLN
jgi:type III restriction enzyme